MTVIWQIDLDSVRINYKDVSLSFQKEDAFVKVAEKLDEQNGIKFQ